MPIREVILLGYPQVQSPVATQSSAGEAVDVLTWPPSPLTLARRLHWTIRLRNMAAPAVWLFLVITQAANSPLPPSPSTVLLVLINTVTLSLFLTRRAAKVEPGKVDMTLALLGTFIVAFLRGNAIEGTSIVPAAIQIYALIGWGLSLASLGRSFGLAPADRGLVRTGAYRLVRHPIYAFELLFFVGYLLQVTTLHTVVILSAWAILQVIRILREESVIDGYGEYREQTKWRLIPGVW